MGRFSWQVVARSGLPKAWKSLHFPLWGHPCLETSFSPTPIFEGATISFDAAWDAASLCTPSPHTSPGLPQSSMRSAAHAGYSISICKSISIRTRNPVRARSRRVGCSTALRVPESRARAARPRAARSRARLLSILRPGSNPRSHWCGRARHWEGAAAGGGSKLAKRRGPPLRAALRKAERAEEGAPPSPRPQPLTPTRGRSMRAQRA